MLLKLCNIWSCSNYLIILDVCCWICLKHIMTYLFLRLRTTIPLLYFMYRWCTHVKPVQNLRVVSYKCSVWMIRFKSVRISDAGTSEQSHLYLLQNEHIRAAADARHLMSLLYKLTMKRSVHSIYIKHNKSRVFTITRCTWNNRSDLCLASKHINLGLHTEHK